MTHALRRRLASTALVAGLVCAGVPALAGTSFAAQPSATRAHAVRAQLDTDVVSRALEVQFAESHWNWTAWNDSTPVAFGDAQPNYQCAEFVARALAAAGLIPGLGPNDPQSDYFDYTAPNGKVYDLLLISELPQYNNLYAYLMDSGIGEDVGDQPSEAQPGDIVVTYLGPNGTPSHTGLVSHAATATGEATVDAHNNARLDYGYSYYAPSHLVRLVPNALLEVWTWAAEQKLLHPTPTTPSAPAAPAAPHQLNTAPGFSDPAGPQV
ncbi:hypothetical protein GXW83_18720 [Streptacidiphilus sp. PB12-B1b]|uniref:amidase domain-containing protein n=1 Tax=Streptacidiphilus sp. PB12-B1b TaxID=2705012 RepID=UPI0015F78BDB|nr:amidase domain-containing protein [Streptacidiphilus sp. PB12-B1b]QMU77427.1 hypothetical protein GXW83_18720 [Streptacidiphilus sp. PB12-B1b]